MNLPSDADASGRSFDEREKRELERVLDSGTLNCTRGRTVREFEEKFASLLGSRFCRCTTSGTAAIHTALSALDLRPGDEILTTPITDMGAITPILYQGAIPVFADVDPLTLNVTPETLEARIGPRTKAILATHLFGNPCDMDGILELGRKHGLPVLEDAAQAFLATWKGKPVGTLGAIGCFSLQQGKHMTTGEGGMVVTDDPALFRTMKLFVDKAWPYGEPDPDHEFLALNYRMTELQGAVALGQLEKLEANVARRIETAEALTEALEDIEGLSLPRALPGARHVYWRYALMADERFIPGGPDDLARMLKERGIWAAPRYVQKPAFECKVLKERRAFGGSGFPWTGEHRRNDPEIVYRLEDTPGAVLGLSRVIVLPWNENLTLDHVRMIADAIRDCVERLRSGVRPAAG